MALNWLFRSTYNESPFRTPRPAIGVGIYKRARGSGFKAPKTEEEFIDPWIGSGVLSPDLGVYSETGLPPTRERFAQDYPAHARDLGIEAESDIMERARRRAKKWQEETRQGPMLNPWE